MATVSSCLHKIDAPIIIFPEQIQKIFGKRALTLTQKQFLKVNNIIEAPKIQESELSHFHPTIYPYMLQSIKMWGCHALYAQKMYSLIDKQNDQAASKAPNRRCSSSNNPIARIDFVTFLLRTADCLVASDIIKILSKFPIAMPLVIRELETDQYVFLLSLYQDVAIKWEAREGRIIENILFRSPFKMLICARVGDNGRCVGKSVILNQLIKKENLFSSRGEPGGKHGKPCTVDGCVEFIWLTEETCSDTLWTGVLQAHYASGTDELILLANLHGDLNNFSDFVDTFEAFSPRYLLFVMPSDSIESNEQDAIMKKAALKNAIHIYVDPHEAHVDERYTIETSMLSDHDNMTNLIAALALSIGEKAMRKEMIAETFFQESKNKRLVQAEQIHTAESQAVIQFVLKNKCKASKQLLKSSRLMNLFMDIFRLSPHKMRKAMTHLEIELSFQSNIESLSARERVQCLRKKRLALFGSEADNAKQIEAVESKINEALAEVDEINLGLEHFFREASSIYQNSIITTPSDTIYLQLPSFCADLLLNGSAVELLNGDDQQLSVDWLTAICNTINRQQPNMKVFVVSIIGLQSSGKSTLLNALFSCKFAVSVGRCSRGLFMRLAFLHEDLRNEFGFDAFLLIDTEGLGSPEKMNDKEAAQKDRRMATLAMGISNLTIINVMGETINEMTEILQIAIVAMARFEKSDMASDILLVQHLQEKNEIRSSGGKDSFCKALKEAFDLTQGHSTDIGALDVECLSNLIRRIRGENFLKQFNPLKDGSTAYAPPSDGYHKDIVDFYKTILTVSKHVTHKQTLLNWSKLVGSYWSCAKEEKFASRFKNAKELIEYLDHEQKLESIQNAIVYAYSNHCPRFESQMRQQINLNNYDKNAFLSQIEDGLTDLPRRCSVVSANSGMCERCNQAVHLIDIITSDVAKTDKEQITADKINSYSASAQTNTRDRLSKMFDAMVIEDKFCDKYGKTINDELSLLLKSNNTGRFTEEQRKKEVDRIWKKLERLSTEGTVDEPVQRKIEREIKCAYQNNENIMEIYLKKVNKENFDVQKAVERNFLVNLIAGSKLSENKVDRLLELLRNLVRDLLRDDRNLKGFEPRLISTLKTNIDEAMNQLQTEFHKKFEIGYRWMAHAYTLQLFAVDMEQLQIKWDSKHNPRVILQNKKFKYITEIDTRLKLGFTAAGDGHIVAQTLYSAMHKQAKSYVEKKLVEDFRAQEWTYHSETVRLKYFESLVKEVISGQKQRAVDYFLLPTREIEIWFKQMADTYDVNRLKVKYVKHLEESKSGIVKVLSQGVMEKAEKYIQEYVYKTDEKYSLSRSNYTNDDKAHFIGTVTNAILDFKCDSDGLENEIVLPSTNKEVMDLLGCTECCPVCHALCWMSRGHVERNSNDKAAALHRTSHQPVGLGFTCYYVSRELMCSACHTHKDSDPWIHYGKPILWSDVKQLYPTWTFENHHNVKFQELMCWFMSMLHQELSAARDNLKPALQSDLQKHNCANLDVNSILKSIHVRLLE